MFSLKKRSDADFSASDLRECLSFEPFEHGFAACCGSPNSLAIFAPLVRPSCIPCASLVRPLCVLRLAEERLVNPVSRTARKRYERKQPPAKEGVVQSALMPI